MSKKPEITLKNIKHHVGLSEETYCYTATIYVDNKRWGTTENRGHGGSDNICAFTGGHQEVGRLNALVKASCPKWGSEFEYGVEYETDLEMALHDLVTDWIREKELKSQLRRKWTYVRGDSVYEIPKTKVADLDRLRGAKWAKDVTFLNDLPFADARAQWNRCLA